VKHPTVLAAIPFVLALAAPVVHASSAATATLSFSVLAGSGFSWAADAGSYGASDVTAAGFVGWSESAGIFSPNFAPVSIGSVTTPGTGVPASSATASSTSTFATAFTFSDSSSTVGTLQASAIVPVAGSANATAFARSYFTLQAGASVTFFGGLVLSTSGDNDNFPATYDTSSLYGYATGLLAVDSQLAQFEVGGPALAVPGSYAITSFEPISLTFTNTGNSAITSYLDSGVYASSVSAVPEPGTYAMLLAGLAIVGWGVSRQRASV